jgi:hypothetical protein
VYELVVSIKFYFAKDPFEMLRDSFKVDREITLNFSLEAQLQVEVLSVLFQIISNCLYSAESDDGVEDKRINDYFQYLGSLDVVYTDLSKLPGTFPDSGEAEAQSYTMANIYSLWKHLCSTLRI